VVKGYMTIDRKIALVLLGGALLAIFLSAIPGFMMVSVYNRKSILSDMVTLTEILGTNMQKILSIDDPRTSADSSVFWTK